MAAKSGNLKQRDIRRLKTVEMKFMRRTAGYSFLDHRRNGDVLEELKADPVTVN
jgi:ABC-type ATPase involved in cell division